MDECAVRQHLTKTKAGVGLWKISFDIKNKTALEAASFGRRELGMPGPMRTPMQENCAMRGNTAQCAEIPRMGEVSGAKRAGQKIWSYSHASGEWVKPWYTGLHHPTGLSATDLSVTGLSVTDLSVWDDQCALFNLDDQCALFVRHGENKKRVKDMLELTLNTGTELKIGDDIRIVFRGDTTSGRLKVAVEAPREKRIERVRSVDEPQQKEPWNTVAQSGPAKKRRVVIVRNQGGLSGGRQG